MAGLLDEYGKPTPKFWRQFGDGLLAVGSTLTAYAISEDIHWLGYTSLGVSVAGKFLTNLFSE